MRGKKKKKEIFSFGGFSFIFSFSLDFYFQQFKRRKMSTKCARRSGRARRLGDL